MRLEKQKALELRALGMSYSMISDRLSVSKSTLSNWLKNLPYTPNNQVLSRIKHGRGFYGLSRQKQRINEIRTLKIKGASEIGELSRRDLFMIGLGLWIGEGSKTMEQIRLVNSDPRVVSLFMRWLSEICDLKNSNITVSMHIYPDSNERSCKDYWMGVTKLPESQFRKTQIDRRLNKSNLKKGKTPYGTLHITVVSNGNPEKGVRLYRKMMGWVYGVVNN